jgi:hypothetical protein
MRKDLTPQRVRAARFVAAGADLLQILLLPAFAPGALSMINDAVDVVVAVALFWLVGWHWAFVPTFFAELVPFVDLVPTWTAAVFLATRGQPLPGAADAVVDVTAKPVSPPPPLPADTQSPRGSSGE